MNYRSRKYDVGVFKDSIWIECWRSTDDRCIYFEETNMESGRRSRRKPVKVVGRSAVVFVYPALHDYDLEVTPGIARIVATALMTGEGVYHVSLKR